MVSPARELGLKRSLPEPAELANSYVEVAQRASRLLRQHIKKTARKGIWFPSDELEGARAFMDLSARLLASPYRLAQAQMAMMRDHFRLWQQTTLRLMGVPCAAVASPDQSDQRFTDEAWEENFLFDFIKQSYLISARHLHQTVARAEGLDDATQRRVNQLTRQCIDALSPTNFALTNPEVLRETARSKGKNLLKGLKNLLKDLESGDGKRRAPIAGSSAFRLGKDLAATPGKVVFQNELLQLIQYQPAGTHQCRKPLLIVPPWINKYYLLDLREDNSFVKWITRQGFTTFIISWANTDQQLSHKSFEDYLVEGTLAAIDAVEQATGEKKIDLLAYCLGGTLLVATLAWMAARRDQRAASATFLTTLIDFSEPGELAEPGALASQHRGLGATGPLAANGDPDSRAAAATSTMLHANDLIWSFVVNQYLLGKDPFPSELLFWNADATRTPATLQRFFVDNFYRANRLVQKGGIALAGVDIDVSRISLPCYFLATIEDHISPWKSCYRGAHLPRGPARFVLGGSGHIGGVVNPPSAGRHDYWTSEALPENADDFLSNAVRHPGSWWDDWLQWLLAQPDGNTLVGARHPGDHALKVIEDAPGGYVTDRPDPPAAAPSAMP